MTDNRDDRPQTTPAQSDVERAEQLMREFYVSRCYDPKAARNADTVKAAIAFTIAAMPTAGRVREVVEPLLRFHETGGHEGDGSDERLALIRTTLGVSPTVEGGQ